MIFITGATGLLGSYLAKLLIQKGHKVRAIKRTTSDLSLLGEYAQQIEWVTGDIMDIPSLEDAMQGVKQVYHCAAVISFIPKEVDYMMRVNIDGTANVMNAALQAGVEKLVHVSSIASFGIAKEGKVIDEQYSDPNIRKCFWYYRSKHYGEREAWRAHAEGLNVVVANPSTILGAGWWDDEPNSLFRDIHQGLKFYTTAHNGFVDVRDVVECLYRLMQSDISGEKFIVSSENISFRDLIWDIADALKVKRPPYFAGRLLREFVWRAEAVKGLFSNARPLVTKETAELASMNFRYSNQKIKDELQFNFRPIKQTIADTAACYLKSKQAGKDFGVFY
jgi:dihydroflavonol-4-reductase